MVPAGRLLAFLVTLTAGMLLFTGAAEAQGKRQVVVDSQGATSAQLSFLFRSGVFSGYSDIRLRIERQGAVLFDDRVPAPPRNIAGGAPFPPGDDGVDALFVRDLDGDGEPEVQVDLFSGGANCCLFTSLFSFDSARGSYSHGQQVWGTSYRLRDLDRDGRPEFVTSDHRLKYLFACNACQRLPPRIFALSNRRLEDVTRRFPAVVRQDARFQLRLIRKRDPFSYRGAVASLTADRCLLGQCRAALRQVRRLLRAGALDRQGRLDYPPWGDAYVSKLGRVLRRFDYLR